jgi:hypothetical protein
VGHPRKPKKRQREQLLVEIARKKKEEQNQDSARSIEVVPQSQGNPGGNVLFWAAPSPGTAMRCVGVYGHSKSAMASLKADVADIDSDANLRFEDGPSEPYCRAGTEMQEPGF